MPDYQSLPRYALCHVVHGCNRKCYVTYVLLYCTDKKKVMFQAKTTQESRLLNLNLLFNEWVLTPRNTGSN